MSGDPAPARSITTPSPSFLTLDCALGAYADKIASAAVASIFGVVGVGGCGAIATAGFVVVTGCETGFVHASASSVSNTANLDVLGNFGDDGASSEPARASSARFAKNASSGALSRHALITGASTSDANARAIERKSGPVDVE